AWVGSEEGGRECVRRGGPRRRTHAGDGGDAGPRPWLASHPRLADASAMRLRAGDVPAVGGRDVILVQPGAVVAGVVDPAPLGQVVARRRAEVAQVRGVIARTIE